MDQLKREINEAIEKEQNCYKNFNNQTQDYETYYDYESRLEKISEGVLESFSDDEKQIINYVKHELKAIEKYPYEWFQEVALNKLILSMYYGYDYIDVDEKLVDDILDYLEDKQSKQKKKIK